MSSCSLWCSVWSQGTRRPTKIVYSDIVHFHPPGLDLPTFEYILRQWDKKKMKFIFTNTKVRKETECSFNLKWVMSHTWFSNEGDLVDHNQDKKNRIWSRFFNKSEGDSSTAPLLGGPTKRNVEQLLLKLCPSSVLGVPRYLFKYVDSIEKANNTAWGTYIFSETYDAIEKAMPQNINEEIKQPNEVVEKIELPQQVIYWKSIVIMNQKLHRDNENKFKDQIAADRVKISFLFVKVATLSAQVRRVREELSEARSRSLTVYKNKRMSSLNMNPASDSHAPSLSSSAPANTSSPSLSSSAPANASSPSPATPSSDNTDNASRENVETTNPIHEKRRRKKTSKVEDEVREVEITLPEC
ncbi:uncharacterized protein A4U43_C10F12230 [Asparagus officinalis]|uniref:Uncharacterized protein n=1 Tax=Asparagus officinalis TaxID=4686 RepID=A0A5P1E5I0_ASPOF|nr:uncharacterized protein A4U43_C10F12230 [Asparagus officinalis]